MARQQQIQIEIKRLGENEEFLEIHLPNVIVRARVPAPGRTIVAPVQDAGILDLGSKVKQIVKVKDENGIVVFGYCPVGGVKKEIPTPSLPHAARASKNLEEDGAEDVSSATKAARGDDDAVTEPLEKRGRLQPTSPKRYEVDEIEAGRKKGEMVLKPTPTTPQDRKSLSIKPKTPGSKTRNSRSYSEAVIDWEKERSRSSARGPSLNTPSQSRSRTPPSSAAMKSVGTPTKMGRRASTSTSTCTPVGRNGLEMDMGMESGFLTPTRKGRGAVGESGKKSSTVASSKSRNVRPGDKKSIEVSPSTGRARRDTVSRPRDDGAGEGSIQRAMDRMKREYPPSTESGGGVASKSSSSSSSSASKLASRLRTAPFLVQPSTLPYRNSHDGSNPRITQRVETSPTQNPKPGSFKDLQNWKPLYKGINAFRANIKAAEKDKKKADGKENESQTKEDSAKVMDQDPGKNPMSDQKQKNEKKPSVFLKRTAEIFTPITDAFGIGGNQKSPRMPEWKRGRFGEVLEAGEGKERGERREDRKQQGDRKKGRKGNRKGKEQGERKKDRKEKALGERKESGKGKEQGERNQGGKEKGKQQGKKKEGEGVKEENGDDTVMGLVDKIEKGEV